MKLKNKIKRQLKRKAEKTKSFLTKITIEVLIFTGLFTFMNFGIDTLKAKQLDDGYEIKAEASVDRVISSETTEQGQIPIEDEENEPDGKFEATEGVKKGLFYTYNAEESQTDGNPYITASGKIVKDGIVANNCLPFGTKIEVDGLGVFEVQDRMNSRYDCETFDVFREDPAGNFKRSLSYKII